MKLRPALLLLSLSAWLALAPAAVRAEKSAQDAAAEAYAKSDYKGAISAWRVLLDQGVADPSLFYNMGTAYAKSGDSGRAVWMFLKARRLAPRDGDIRENLQAVAKDYAQRVAVFPIPPLETVYGLLSLNEWAWAAGAATLLCGLAAAAAFAAKRGGRLRGSLRRLAFALGVAAAVGHNFALIKYWQEVYTPWGVVVGRDCHPQAAPSEGATAYEFVLPPGTVIQLGVSGVQGWVKAIYNGRNEVFLKADQVERL